MSFIGLVAIVVEEYDPAIEFFVDVLGFELVEDSPSLTNDGRPKRWVVVRPPGAETGILLAGPTATTSRRRSGSRRPAGSDSSSASTISTPHTNGWWRRMSSSSRCRAPSRTVEWPCSSTSPAIAGICSVVADATIVDRVADATIVYRVADATTGHRAIAHPVGSVAPMSRERAEHVAQGTWRSGSLHVWGWNGESTASAAWLYGGFGHNRWSGAENGWHDTPASYGELSRIELELPSGLRKSVPSVRLDPYGAAVWLSDTPGDDELSASLAWFAELSAFAVAHVTGGRLTPTVVEEGPFVVARWIPVVDDEIERTLAALDDSAPPICHNGTRATAADMLTALVDGLARSLLHSVSWKPELGRQRSAQVQVLRAVFTSLARNDPVVRGGTTEFERELESVRGLLHRHGERLAGRPVFAPRLRLTIPEDAGDPWEVTLEIYDELDPGRWCTADDVWNGSGVALDLARDERHLPRMELLISDLAGTVAQHIPGLADLAAEHEPSGVELDLAAADDFLDIAPHELGRLGIALIGPEHLVRAKVGVRGRATPAPVDDRHQRFGVEAIVDWSAVIDDTPISDVELARVEAAGARLLHTGNRWVRIDPAGLRRARTVLSDHRREHASLDAVALLRMASGNEGSTATHDR